MWVPVRTVTGLPFAGALPVIGTWARNNGCSDRPAEEPVSPQVKKLSFADCRAATVQYIVDKGGHSWPGAASNVRQLTGVGLVTEDISASELAWAFFKIHPKR